MIIFSCEMIPWIVAIFGLVTADFMNITDQQTSEGNHHDQVAILKQIRKLNDDGSYTFGYEAGDGSFKVETRDVLGNVKGTFGFIDANGEIKRVTYSSSNGTGFKATTTSPSQEEVSVIQSIPLRSNHSFDTNQKKSMISFVSTDSSPLLMTTTPSSSTKSNVIQSILTRKYPINTTTVPSSTVKNTEKFTKTIFGQYLRNFSNRSSQFIKDPKQLSAPSEDKQATNYHKNDSQKSQSLSSNSDVKADTEKSNSYTRVSLEDILQPVNQFRDYNRRPEIKISNNNFRRQIEEKPSIKVRESTEENTSNENFDVFNGQLLSTTRPLFTTTTTVSSNTDRAKITQRNKLGSYRFHQTPKFDILQSNKKNLGPAKFYNIGTEKLEDDLPETMSTYNRHDSSSHEKDEIVDYMVKHPIQTAFDPHQHREKNYKQLPVGIIFTNIPSTTAIESQASNDEVVIGRRFPLKNQVPIEQVHRQLSEYKEDKEYPANDDFTGSSFVPLPNMHATTNPVRLVEKQVNEFMPPHLESDPLLPIDLKLFEILYKHLQHQRSQYQQYQLMREKNYLQNYFNKHLMVPFEHLNMVFPPLNKRDFESILRKLMVNQRKIHFFDHPSTFFNDASNEDRMNIYQNPISQYSSAYDQHSTKSIPVIIPRKYTPKITVSKSNVSKMNNQVNLPFNLISKIRSYDNSDHIGRSGTINFNNDETFLLPTEETFLMKLLQMALDNNKQQRMLYKIPIPSRSDTNVLNALLSKIGAVSVYRKSGPIRNVQIISTGDSDENNNNDSNP